MQPAQPEESVVFDGRPAPVLIVEKVLVNVIVGVAFWIAHRYALAPVTDFVHTHLAEGASPSEIADRAAWARVALRVLTLAIVAICAWRAIVGGLRLFVTRYRITTTNIQEEIGILNRHIENVEIARVSDVHVKQPLLLRLFGYGDLVVVSSDRTAPFKLLRGLPDPKRLMDNILAAARPKEVFELRT